MYRHALVHAHYLVLKQMCAERYVALLHVSHDANAEAALWALHPEPGSAAVDCFNNAPTAASMDMGDFFATPLKKGDWLYFTAAIQVQELPQN